MASNSAEVWLSHKENLQRLYVLEDKKLSDVMNFMLTHYGFKGTKKQYEKHFKAWGFRKNLTKEEWEAVGQQVKKRKRDGKESEVFVDGRLLPHKKVQKETSRYEAGGSIEKYISNQTKTVTNGINVCTPPVRSVAPILRIDNLPFLRYTEFFDSQVLLSSAMTDMRTYKESFDNLITPVRRSAKAAATELMSQPLFSPNVQRDSLRDAVTALERQFGSLSSATAAFLPENLAGGLLLPRSNWDVINSDSADAVVKLVIYLLSNNLVEADTWSSTRLWELIRNHGGLRLLDRLSSAEGPTTEAFLESMFRFAVYKKDVQVVGYLLKRGVNPDIYIPDVDSNALFFAAVSGNVSLATVLIRATADLDLSSSKYGDYKALSPLHAAIRRNDKDMVRLLANSGAKIDCLIDDYDSNLSQIGLLHYAAYSGRAEIVDILLKAGAKVNFAGSSRQCALHLAVCRYHWNERSIHDQLEIVKLLLKAGAAADLQIAVSVRVEGGKMECGDTALDIALRVETAKMEVVGGIPTMETPRMETPRTEMPQEGTPELFQVLLDAGAKVNSDGRALCQAARAGYGQVVQSILARGGRVTDFTVSGHDVLQWAICRRSKEIVRVLLENGARVNCRLELDSIAALQLSSYQGDADIVRMLVQAGADVNGPPRRLELRDGQFESFELSVLQAAALSGSCEIVQLLLDAGADPTEHKRRSSPSPIALAAETHCFKAFELLLKTDSCFLEDVRSKNQPSPLAASIAGGQMAIVNALLDAGVDPNARSWDGTTPLVSAVLRGRPDDKCLFSLDHLTDPNVPYKGNRADPVSAADFPATKEELVKLLLRLGADVNARCSDGKHPLICAIRANMSEVVRHLIEHGADVDAKQQHRDQGRSDSWLPYWPSEYREESPLITLIHSSIRATPGLVQLLLDKGADTNFLVTNGKISPMTKGETPLIAAIWQGDAQLARLLMNNGAKVNVPGGYPFRKTALGTAAYKRDYQLVRELLQRGADTTYNDSWFAQAVENDPEIVDIILAVTPQPPILVGRVVLRQAVRKGSQALIEKLVRRGVDVNAQLSTSRDDTALRIACRDFRTTRTLLNAGADPNRIIHDAVRQRSVPLVQLLIQFGADVNIPEPKDCGQSWITTGRTCLQHAAMLWHLDLVRILLEAGADANAPASPDGGVTALQAAVCHSSVDHKTLEYAQMLLQAGADVNAPPAPYCGVTALQAAVQSGNLEVILLLLESGADVNGPPARHRGVTALQAAAIGGYAGIVALLIEKGADVMAAAAETDGRTALEGAAEHGRIDTVQLLLNAMAEHGGPGDAQYESSIKLARNEGHYAVARLIQSHRDG